MLMNSRFRFLILSLIPACVFCNFLVLGVNRNQAKNIEDEAPEQWEYLIVAGGTSNLSTSGNDQYPSGRKQPDGSFAREFFPLERNFDKLGAKGWELASVLETRGEPLYYFKRRKK
jgi:hypothetical protein